jgi:diguanylate cyclase (GGDEF)-like protein/PAS domain S-box-containing protein
MTHRRSRARDRVRAYAWLGYLAFVALGTLCYVLAPRVSRSGVLFNLLGVSAAGAIIAGVRIHRPERRLPWYLFATAQLVFVTGDFLYYTLPSMMSGYTVDFPSVGDIPYLAVYPLIIAGLLLLIHTRNPRRDRTALVDALIIGLGVGVVSWAYLMVPYARNANLPLGAKALSIAYPLMDVLVIAVTARLAVDAGRRAPVFFMLVAALVSLVAVDAAYGVIELNGTYGTGSLLDLGWIGYYAVWGAAALHPSMRTLSMPVADPPRTLSRGRLLMLGAATLTSPMVQVIRLRSLNVVEHAMLVLASIVLFLLVVLRLRMVVQQHEEAEHRERALREAGAALVSAPSREATWEAAVRATRALAGEAAHLVVCDAGEILESTLAALSVSAREQLRAGTSVAFEAVPPRLAEAVPLPPRSRVLLSPLTGRDGLGAVLVVATAQAMTPGVRDGVEALCSQVALALEAANLAEDLHRDRSEARFRSLVQNSTDIVTVVDVHAVIRYQSPSIEHILGHAPAALVGTSLLNLLHPDDHRRMVGLLGDIARRQRVRPQLLEARWRACSGGWRSVEMLWTDLTEDPNVAGVVLNTRDIGERKAFEERLEHQAFHDPVTDLANRALFQDRVQHALDLQGQDSHSLAVVFMDLDDFKTVNDSLGRATGDQLLHGVGERLRRAVRSADTPARLGGDEFALLLEHVDAAGAGVVAENVLTALGAPFVVEGREVFIRASLGIAVSGLDGVGVCADELLRDADAAMYTAKERGKCRHELFEPGMRRAVVDRLELRGALERALEHGEFLLHYQPVIELRTGRVTGVEALVRWQHPVLGLTAPGDFIPLAEETGLIVPIGRWVLEEACRQARTFQQEGGDAAALTVAVNLSARQLQHPGLLDEVATALRMSGIDPATVILEITESMMIRDPGLAAGRLRELKRLGVRLAVDDFGVAYSSLSYLSQFPLDVLKVDRCFIDRMHRTSADSAIAEAIIHLAHALGLRAVAEGIETAEQVRHLLDLDCCQGQGYYLARPMDAPSAAAFLERRAHHVAGIRPRTPEGLTA